MNTPGGQLPKLTAKITPITSSSSDFSIVEGHVTRPAGDAYFNECWYYHEYLVLMEGCRGKGEERLLKRERKSTNM